MTYRIITEYGLRIKNEILSMKNAVSKLCESSRGHVREKSVVSKNATDRQSLDKLDKDSGIFFSAEFYSEFFVLLSKCPQDTGWDIPFSSHTS